MTITNLYQRWHKHTSRGRELLPSPNFKFQDQKSLPDSVHLAVLDAENEVHHHSRKKRNGQDGGTESVIDAALPAASDTLCSPMECDEGVDHGAHGDDGEEGGGDATDTVTEVEEADGETAQDDGEVEPGEEGTLVGEEDFGLDAGGQGNSLAYDCQRELVKQGCW